MLSEIKQLSTVPSKWTIGFKWEWRFSVEGGNTGRENRRRDGTGMSWKREKCKKLECFQKETSEQTTIRPWAK